MYDGPKFQSELIKFYIRFKDCYFAKNIVGNTVSYTITTGYMYVNIIVVQGLTFMTIFLQLMEVVLLFDVLVSGWPIFWKGESVYFAS